MSSEGITETSFNARPGINSEGTITISKEDYQKLVAPEETVTISKEMYDKLMTLVSKSPLDDVVLISGRSCLSLSQSIAISLNKQLANVTLSTFANTEINVIINETVRKKHVFIIQTGSPYGDRSINDHIMETMLLLDACHRSGAESISVVMATYAYARSDKKDNSRVPIGGSLIMNMMQLYADRVIALDLHAAQIQGFTTIPSDNLYAINIFCNYIKTEIFNGVENINSKFILVSPDAGSEKRTKAYSKKLNLTSTILTKQRNYSIMNSVAESTLTGDHELVRGKCAIILDDMIDTAGTMVEGIKELKKYGINGVIIMVSHGVLSGPAIDRINACEDILRVVVTNSICQEENKLRCPKLVVLDIGPLFADVIEKIMTGGSLSELFV